MYLCFRWLIWNFLKKEEKQSNLSVCIVSRGESINIFTALPRSQFDLRWSLSQQFISLNWERERIDTSSFNMKNIRLHYIVSSRSLAVAIYHVWDFIIWEHNNYKWKCNEFVCAHEVLMIEVQTKMSELLLFKYFSSSLSLTG